MKYPNRASTGDALCRKRLLLSYIILCYNFSYCCATFLCHCPKETNKLTETLQKLSVTSNYGYSHTKTLVPRGHHSRHYSDTDIYIYIYIRTDLRKRNNNYYRTVMSPSIQIKKSNKSVDYRSRIEIFRTRKLEQSHRLMQLALALAVTSCAHDSASYK